MKSLINPNWLIIQGCRRSGTTLLTTLLNTHPLIFITYEYNLAKSLLFSKKILKNYNKIIPKNKLEKFSLYR